MKKYLILLYAFLAYFVANAIVIAIMIHFKADIGFKSIRILADKYGALYALSILVIIGPFLEETIFRWPLKYKPYKLYISIFLGSFYFFNRVFTFSFTFKSLLSSIIVSFLLITLAYILNKINFFEKKNNILLLSIFSAILFGFFHIKVIIGTEAFNLFVILYIIPKIILGLFLNKIRLNLGMKFNIGLHMFINLLGGLSLISEIFK